MHNIGHGYHHRQKAITAIFFIFILCCLFHYVEVLAIRTDETFLADNFINKVLGIAVLIVCLRIFHYSWRDIGFRPDKLRYIGYGLLMGIFCFAVAYTIEYLFLLAQNLSPGFTWYISGFSLSGGLMKQTGALAFFLCILFNIINVVMEEDIFRGLFIKLGLERLTFVKANWLAAFLFGLWHLSLPVRSLIDGQMTIGEAVFMGTGYIILAALMGIKWGLWLRNTNCLWFGLSEHFFNNTISNVLHVASASGYDEMQIVRILIAQMLSLTITLIINRRAKMGALILSPGEPGKPMEKI